MNPDLFVMLAINVIWIGLVIWVVKSERRNR